MPPLHLTHATLLATFDDAAREIPDGGLIIEDGIITHLGPTAELPPPPPGATTLDLTGHVVLPGLVNTHHHLFQTLTRALPAAQNHNLFNWLTTLYPIWQGITPEHIYTSAQIGLAELVLSGCTTASDHQYLFPNGARLDDAIAAAQSVGLRFHAARGSMSLGQSHGGLPPDSICEHEDFILTDCERVISHYHDPTPGSFLQILLAPCAPFNVTQQLMRDTAALARQHGLRLHTHLAETRDEETYCLDNFGVRPFDYMANLGWTGPDVWYAHCVYINSEEIARFAVTGSGVAHCPSANMRLASGIAPIPAMRQAGVTIGLGVDGSSSNDGGNLLAEARLAFLLARLGTGASSSFTARDALYLATRGGAQILGRTDIGQLAPGLCADLIAFDLNTIELAGAAPHDPLAALIFASTIKPRHVFVGGRHLVNDYHFTPFDLAPVIATQNRLARALTTP